MQSFNYNHCFCLLQENVQLFLLSMGSGSLYHHSSSTNSVFVVDWLKCQTHRPCTAHESVLTNANNTFQPSEGEFCASHPVTATVQMWSLIRGGLGAPPGELGEEVPPNAARLHVQNNHTQVHQPQLASEVLSILFLCQHRAVGISSTLQHPSVSYNRGLSNPSLVIPLKYSVNMKSV